MIDQMQLLHCFSKDAVLTVFMTLRLYHSLKAANTVRNSRSSHYSTSTVQKLPRLGPHSLSGMTLSMVNNGDHH